MQKALVRNKGFGAITDKEPMKILLLASLVSLPLWALSPKQSVEQLEELNRPAVICADDDADTKDEADLHTPADALKDINSGKLTFMGRKIFPGSGQNYTCVYKSDTAYILYNNCMGNKKESSALDIEVISFTGDISSFYIQNATSEAAVSNTRRSEYSMAWRVSVTKSPAVTTKMTVDDLIKHKEKHGEVSGGCSIGATFKAQDMTSKAFCIGGVNNPAWKEEAQKFWTEPTEDWYTIQKYLRKVVEATKF